MLVDSRLVNIYISYTSVDTVYGGRQLSVSCYDDHMVEKQTFTKRRLFYASEIPT